MINLLHQINNLYFSQKTWTEINDESQGTSEKDDESRGKYEKDNQIRFKTPILKSSLCDYSDA